MVSKSAQAIVERPFVIELGLPATFRLPLTVKS
jgi:hypothetical protein